MSSQALTTRSSDNALMPPPPPPKRIKRPTKVIDEDSYTDALSHIIARDFFPGLIESDAQQDYLNALDSKDSDWIASAGKKLTEVMTPGPDGRRIRGRRGTSMTPLPGLYGQAGETPRNWGGDTPGSVVSTTTTTSASPSNSKVDTNMSLGAFQAKYTSEDNESFYKLLDKQNQKKSEKYAWIWDGNKIPAARQIAYRKQQEAIKATTAEQESVDGKKALAIVEPDKRKAMPDSWNPSGANHLMFAPSGIEDDMETVAQKAAEKSRAPPKTVVYDNTRLRAQITASDNGPSIPPSPTLSAIQSAIAGRPRLSASEIGAGSAYDGSETPRVNGYAFVDSEEPSPPTSPQPHQEINLGPGDATPNPFVIKEKSSREALHHRMVDKVARGKRVEKLNREIKTPMGTPRFSSSPRIGKAGLTPAAQKLLGRVGNSTPSMSLWEGKATPRRSELGLVTPQKK